jgi:hypothetical protein
MLHKGQKIWRKGQAGVVKYVGAWWIEVRWESGQYESILDKHLSSVDFFVEKPPKRKGRRELV